MATQEKTVDEFFDLTCTPHDVIAATKLFAKIARVVGPALARNEITSDTEVTTALSALLSGLDDQAIDQLITDTLKLSTCIRRDGEKPVLFELGNIAKINKAFEGHGLMLFKAMAFALEVNFKSFFGASGQLDQWLAKAQAKL